VRLPVRALVGAFPGRRARGAAEPAGAARLGALLARVRTLVLVTGTNGKSTTAHLIEGILARAGRFPIRNRDGANLVDGLCATLASARVIGRRPVVLEVDEGALPEVVPPARPSLLVVTNVFRDQLDRYGEVDAVAARIRRAVAATPRDCILVGNADDPAVADILLRAGRRATFFGLDLAQGGPPGPSADAVLCPRCGESLTFSRAFLSHLGHYACRRCGFVRPVPGVAATGTAAPAGAAVGVGDRPMRLPAPGRHSLYNALAALAAARELGVPDRVSFRALASLPPMPGRSEWIAHRGRRVFLNLVKNPAGFEAAVDALAVVPRPRHVLLLLNDRAADGADVSWIWDAEFEMFRGDRVWVGGSRAEALALRLKYARVAPPLELIRDHGRALGVAAAATPRGAPLCVLMNYSSMLDLFGALRKDLRPA